MGHPVAPALFLCATAVAASQTSRTEITAGAGTGTYAHHYGCGGLVRAPYNEVGVQVRHEHESGFGGGVQLAARMDDASASPDIRPENRFFGSLWGSVAGRYGHLRAGIVFSDYHRVRLDEGRGLDPFPRVALGLGPRHVRVEAGFFDAPMMAAAGGGGGEGVLTLRVLLEPRPGHRISVGAGAQPAEGYLTGTYLGEIARGFAVGGGGYAAPDSSGAFVAIGGAFE
jgi:hypothetical protein